MPFVSQIVKSPEDSFWASKMVKRGFICSFLSLGWQAVFVSMFSIYKLNGAEKKKNFPTYSCTYSQLFVPNATRFNTQYFDQKYKFSNKNNMVSAWRNFKNIFPRPLFIIIFRPEMLKFHPYSILTGDTRVEFVIYCVLSLDTQHEMDFNLRTIV